MADQKSDNGQDQAESTQDNSLNVFITGAATGAGLALIQKLTRAGHKVTGEAHNGAPGAVAIRARGGLPIYPGLTREGEVYSVMAMSKADVVVHLMPLLLNGIPHHPTETDTLLTLLDDGTETVMSVAGQMGVKRVISLSYAALYGKTGDDAADESASIWRDNDLFKTAAHAEAVVRDGGIPGYVLRSGYVYGGYSHALRATADRIRAGRAVPAGSHPAAWIYEDDLAEVIFRLATREEDDGIATIYNVDSGVTASPDTFIDMLGDAIGIGAPPRISPLTLRSRQTPLQAALMQTSVKLNTEKIKAALDWSPEVTTIGAGLERAMVIWRAGDDTTGAHADKPERATVTV